MFLRAMTGGILDATYCHHQGNKRDPLQLSPTECSNELPVMTQPQSLEVSQFPYKPAA